MCNTAGRGSSPLNELITSEVWGAAGLFQKSVCLSLHQLSPMLLLTYGWFDLCTPPIFSRGHRWTSHSHLAKTASFLSIIVSLLASAFWRLSDRSVAGRAHFSGETSFSSWAQPRWVEWTEWMKARLSGILQERGKTGLVPVGQHFSPAVIEVKA